MACLGQKASAGPEEALKQDAGRCRGREFDPDRWFEADGTTLIKEPRHYIPFSEGPRFCLGATPTDAVNQLHICMLP